MRISDWSSDVCSSDLLEPMAPLVLVGDEARLVAKKYMQLETLFHELSHSLGPGTITVDGRQTTVNDELKEQASAIEEGKADVRSEEHTSELQSLMRISYAVFCLKKKSKSTQDQSSREQQHRVEQVVHTTLQAGISTSVLIDDSEI